MSSKERRRYFRIDDVIGLKSEVIEQQHVEQRLQNFQANQHEYSMLNEFNYQIEQHRADLKHIKEKMPEVGRYLEVLQKQLDLLTDRLLQDEDGFTETEKKVNLSAQGLSFYSDESVHQGDIAELHLRLLPERHKIVIFARVISCTHENNDLGKHRISLDFEHIQEADRELLVKHVHGKQLRALGAARFEEDSE